MNQQVTTNSSKGSSDKENIEKRIIKIVAEQLNVEKEKVTPETSFADDLGADSLDQVELVMAFEEEFGCEISDDIAEKIKKVSDAVSLVCDIQDSKVDDAVNDNKTVQ